MRKVLIFGIVLISLLLFCIVPVEAARTNRDNVAIDAEDFEYTTVYYGFWDYDADEVDVDVSSDIAVDVYIMSDTNFNIINPDYSKAALSKEGITTTSFTYKVPDDQSYYLVISNPNNETATVSYSYTDFTEEILQDMEDAVWYAGMMCLLIIVVIIVVIVVIVVLIIYLGKKKRQQMPPPGYPPQTPPPYPPQQPGYPPQQPGYQQPPPPPQ